MPSNFAAYLNGVTRGVSVHNHHFRNQTPLLNGEKKRKPLQPVFSTPKTPDIVATKLTTCAKGETAIAKGYKKQIREVERAQDYARILKSHGKSMVYSDNKNE